ncbi:MAG: hypothetical protein HQM08_05245 [Candidatus Riflebacteria bacterium]|nr:hypothetical protein [Candidatus Riflebacteria bacterium]
MSSRRILRNCFFVFLFLNSCFIFGATDGSNELQKACRENLRKLRAAMENFLKNEKQEIPTWAKFESVYKMLLTTKYLPEVPISPTVDCRYFLVYKSPKVFDWYCDLHGVETGDEKITFRYHEFQFTGQVNSKYLDVEKYKRHAENLRRWIRYSPTLVENIKYQYARNPTTTILMVIFGSLIVYFIYKNVFGP